MELHYSKKFIISTAMYIALCIFPLSQTFAQDTPIPFGKELITSLGTEIAALEQRISVAEEDATRYDGGLILNLIHARIETMKLTRAVLENRAAAEAGGATLQVIVPVAQPNPALTDEILVEIQNQMQNVAEAEEEARTAGGLIAAIATSRVQTEKMVLANLRSSWMMARYGVLLPAEASTPTPKASTSSPDSIDLATANSPDWADPDYPEIDYTKSIYKQLIDEGFTIHGWWGLNKTRAAIDDSLKVVSINVSEYTEGFSASTPKLLASCSEGMPAIIFDADDYIMSDYNSNSIRVTYRIDDQDAVNDRWSKLTSSKGAGKFGQEGQDMIRALYNADQLFLRLYEKDGERHDATFKLAGAQTVFDAVALACNFSMLNLSSADYRAIQTMLNTAGYDAGKPDGVWGLGSAKAMSAWQAENGIDQTGTPNRESLRAMGLDF
jgi:peptidoglycan hydrolase-like protein with peptidoglycan-binding domain